MVYSNVLFNNNIIDCNCFQIKIFNTIKTDPYLSKTLHNSLSNVKKLIEQYNNEWDNKKKNYQSI